MKKFLMLLSLTLVLFALASCQLPILGGDGSGNGGSNNGAGDGSGDSTGSACTSPDAVNGKHNVITVPGKAPKCDQTGTTDEEICSLCMAVITPKEIIPAKGHKLVVIPAVEASCTAEGATIGYKCSACNVNVVKPNVIPKLPHTIVANNDVAPTCTESGSIGGTHCTECFQNIDAPTVIAPYGHERGLDHIVLYEGYAATCTDTGLTEGRYCTLCETTIAEQTVIDIDANAHPQSNIVTLEAVQATCYSEGLTEGKHCDNCGVTYVEQTVVEKAGHNLEVVPGGEAVLSNCATETNGYTAHKKCTSFDNCGYEEFSEEIPYEHNCSNWETVIEAGVGTAGEKRCECSECHNVIVEDIPALLPDGSSPDDIPDYIDPDGVV